MTGIGHKGKLNAELSCFLSSSHYNCVMGKVQDLQNQALQQYQDLRDTVLTLEAMEADDGKGVSWTDLKTELDA